MTNKEAWRIRHNIERAARLLDDATALESVEMFPRWGEGIDVTTGERYAHNGILYACVQSHTTQASWTPDITPALWRVVSVEEFPEWRQPTGATDAYNKDDKVTYNGIHYISNVDANIWQPEVYGWEKYE